MGIPLLLQHPLGLVPTLRHLYGLQGHQQRVRRAQQCHCCDGGGGEGGEGDEEKIGYNVRGSREWIGFMVHIFERLRLQAHGVLIHRIYIIMMAIQQRLRLA